MNEQENNETLAVNKAYILNFINDLLSKSIKFDDEGIIKIKKIINIIVSYNPYSNVRFKNDDIKVLIMNDNHFKAEKNDDTKIIALFIPSDTILVSKNFIVNLLEGKESFARLLNVLGHERQHFLQNYFVETFNEQSELPEEIAKQISDLSEQMHHSVLTDKQIYNIITLLKNCVSNDYFDELKSLSEKELIKKCKDLSYSLYFQQIYEENARVKGADFARVFLENLSKDNNGNRHLQNYIKDWQKEIEKFVQDNEFKQAYVYSIYNEFNNQIKAISFDLLLKIGRRLDSISPYIDDERYANDENLVDKYNNIVECAMYFLVKSICESKSTDELIDYFFEALEVNTYTVSDRILNILKKREDMTPELKNKLKESFSEYYFSDNYHSYMVDYSIIYEPKDMENVLIELTRLQRFSDIYNFISCIHGNISIYDLEDVDLNKAITILIKEIKIYISKLKNFDKTICLSDLFFIDHTIKELIEYYHVERYDLLKLSSEVEELLNEEEKYDNQTDSEKFENFKRIYGETKARNYFTNRKLVDLDKENAEKLRNRLPANN